MLKRPQMGININDKEEPWTDLILDGVKRIETRDRATLHPYLGQRVGIVRTGKGKATLVGEVTICGCTPYPSRTVFRSDEDRHCVKAGSKFDWKEGKLGYFLDNPIRYAKPIEVNSKGMVSRFIGDLKPRRKR